MALFQKLIARFHGTFHTFFIYIIPAIDLSKMAGYMVQLK